MNNLFSQDTSWCWHKDRKVNDAGYTLFRKRFKCQRECELQFAVSADNRYNLYLDGCLIGRGPCKGDLQHYSYEEYRRTLSAGEHVLAVEVVVWRGGWRSSPAAWSEIHCGGGLVVGGLCGTERLETPNGWRCNIDYGRIPLEWTESWEAEITTPLPPMDKIECRSFEDR